MNELRTMGTYTEWELDCALSVIIGEDEYDAVKEQIMYPELCRVAAVKMVANCIDFKTEPGCIIQQALNDILFMGQLCFVETYDEN